MRVRESKIRIRPATRRDINLLVRIHNSSIIQSGEDGFSAPRTQQTFADQERLNASWREPNNVEGEEVIVAEVEDVAVAYVTFEDKGDVVELDNIDVTSDHQGRGIGTLIVKFLEERARREGKVAVTLGTSRSAAGVAWRSLPWWLALGYQVTGEEENEWTRSIGPGVREIRMRKELN